MTDSRSKSNDCVSRLGECEVCAKRAARYACPKCEVKTCSVSCVHIHKRELLCDGVRDRTKYMPLSEMTEREFMSDYCFLEEATRYAEDRKKDQSKRYTHQQRQLPLPLHRMRTVAAKRGTKLQFLLPNFSRHKQNSTYMNWKTQCFFWHIEWVFTHADGSESTRFVDPRCDEQKSLSELLHKYLSLQDEETARQQRKVLQHHQSAGIGQLTLWLRAEGVKCSGSRCYALAAHKTLRENLVGKTIVEFPTIYVSYEQRPPTGYEIIDTEEQEDELSADVAKSANVVQKRPKAEQKQTAAKRSKTTATVSKELPELHNIYELAASFNEQEKDDDEDEDDDDDEEEDDELQTSSDDLPIDSEEPLTTCVY